MKTKLERIINELKQNTKEIEKMRYDLTKKTNLVLGDCLNVLKELPDQSIDLVLTDPPYGIGINKMNFVTSGAIKVGNAYRNDYSKASTNWDAVGLTENYFKEISRVSKNQIIFGANNYPSLFPASRCWIVWDKRGDEKYNNDFSDGEIAYTSFEKPTRIFRYLWSGMLQENMEKNHKEIRYHPTQKPVALMEWILKNYSEKDQIILDCFMGSNPVGVAALKLQRRFFGVEIDSTYFEIAKKRISDWENQTRLGDKL